MKSYSAYLNERFINAVGSDAEALELKHKYKSQVWELLQKSYAPIGGIKGNGFNNKDEMVHKIPFWKIIAKNGTVHAVALYKDKNGRKLVASGSDGSDYAKKHLHSSVVNDLKRAYGEKSKAALGFLMKNVPWSVLEPYVKTPSEVQKIAGADEKIVPISSLRDSEIPQDGKLTLTKYPQLKDRAYLRDIGGNMVFKIMVGTPNKKIL